MKAKPTKSRKEISKKVEELAKIGGDPEDLFFNQSLETLKGLEFLKSQFHHVEIVSIN